MGRHGRRRDKQADGWRFWDVVGVFGFGFYGFSLVFSTVFNVLYWFKNKETISLAPDLFDIFVVLQASWVLINGFVGFNGVTLQNMCLFPCNRLV